MVVAENQRGEILEVPYARTLIAGGGKPGQGYAAVLDRPERLRRMTPTECERLQGFPDGWTDIATASDSARYKALGNSVAIPCVTFVLRGIAAVLRMVE